MSATRDYQVIYDVHNGIVDYIEGHCLHLVAHTTRDTQQAVAKLQKEGSTIKDVFIGQECQDCVECASCGGDGTVYKRRAKWEAK